MATETEAPVVEEQLDGLGLALYSIGMAFVQLFGWALAAAAYLCNNNAWRSPRVSKMLWQGKVLFRRFWTWLECPAPDQPRPMEDPSSLSYRAMTAINIVVIVLALISLTALWILFPTA